VERSANMQNTQKLFKIVNEICNTYTAKLPIVKDETGKTLDEKAAVKLRWKEYYQELYNKQSPTDNTILAELPSTNAEEYMDDILESCPQYDL